MSDSYIISRVIRATPKRLFEAWLDSREHSDITGLAAIVDPAVGGIINALDGLIAGTNIQVEPYHRIVQVWEVAFQISRRNCAVYAHGGGCDSQLPR